MVFQPFLRPVNQSRFRMNDLCGRFNSIWTVGILLLFSTLTFYIHTAYDPVTCWTPAEFTSQMVRYTNKMCWESPTYYVVKDNTAPPDRFKPSVMKKPPYRWIPLILLVQAMLFKLPDIVLSVGQGLVGFRSSRIFGLTDGYETLNMADRDRMGRQVGQYVKSWINSTVLKGCPWGWLTLLFLFTKLLYFINVVTQLSIMNAVLKSENQSSFGLQLADDIFSNQTLHWRTSSLKLQKGFLCDFSIRKLSMVHSFTTQCFYSNITYYEMVFGIMWLVFVLVSITTTFSGLNQLLLVLVPLFRRRFVKRYLHLSEEMTSSPSDNDIARFAGSEITEDGVMILKAIGEASSEHLVRDAVIYLWNIAHIQQPQGARGQYVPPPSGHQGYTPESHQLQEFPDCSTRVGAYRPVKD
ncbi:innexin unc-9-like [Ylistrum balloti]|uniref:innexin unc-9-like n=1 Tax=Ylistrum balloti TaxID=509963 RepID=UPI002905F248|nr:innexin unc-9-like [Ylistrum balloti]